MRLLFVEDDPLISRDVAKVLQKNGYLVDIEPNGEEAWFKGDIEEYSVAVLDLGLPGMDGLSILKRWRENERNFPVLILTARGNWSERVEGIDAGADDYLTKPFQMEELLARLRAIVRRAAGQASPVILAGKMRLDTKLKSLTIDGLSIDLSPMEYRCLHYLALNRDRIVSQMELTEQLYAQDFERDSNSVEVLIARMRRKLGKGIIKTKRGFGYTLSEDISS